MDELNIMAIIDELAREKGVAQEIVIEALEAGLTSASKKSHLNIPEMNVHIIVEDDEAVIVARRKVVDEVVWPGLEISLGDARGIHPNAEIGDELDMEISPAIFGRNAAQIAKQVVMQRIKEAERDLLLIEYRERIGEIVTGAVKGETKGKLVVDLGRTEAIMPFNHRITGEDYRPGDRIRALLLEVRETPKAPQLILSRAVDDFLLKLFEMEVPEIYEGIVSIVAVAREPGSRAKIAVKSSDARVDPVGTCVGMRGYRVQAVVRELSGEKVDIIRYSESVEEFTRNALSPAQINSLEVDYDNREIIVVVPENQLSLAIGKNGQNVRLAAKLVGWKLDIYSEMEREELRRREMEEAETAIAFLMSLPGVGKGLAEAMYVEGFLTAEDIVTADVKELTEIPGIGLAKARKIKETAEEYLVRSAARAAAELETEAEEAGAESKEPEGRVEAEATPETGAGLGEPATESGKPEDQERAESDETGIAGTPDDAAGPEVESVRPETGERTTNARAPEPAAADSEKEETDR